MKASDLGHQHIGERITVTGRHVSAGGILVGISHQAETNRDYSAGGSFDYLLAPTESTAYIAGLGPVELSPNDTVEVQA